MRVRDECYTKKHLYARTGTHDYTDQPWLLDAEGKHYQICRGCGVESEHSDHTFVNDAENNNHKCSVCGTAQSHAFSENAKDVKIDGNKHGKECSICHGVVVTGNHDFSKCVSNEDGTHKIVCADCGVTQESHDKDACTFDTGVVTKQPTTTETGIKTYTCTVCGYTKTEPIPKKEAEKTEPSVAPSSSPSVAPSTAPSVAPSETPALAKQTITVTKKAKKTVTFKASSLKKKKATLKLNAKAKTKLSYKVTKYPKNAKKYISVTKKGVVTMKKGAKKGTYRVTITAKADQKYNKATKVITIKVK